MILAAGLAAILLAPPAALGQVRMPWMAEARLPQCSSPESRKLVTEQRWSEALELKERELAQVGPVLDDLAVYTTWVCLQSSKAGLLTRLQRHKEAVELVDVVLPNVRGRLGIEHPATLRTELFAAWTYGSAGRRDQQIRMLQDLRPRMEKVHGPRSGEMSGLLRDLSGAYQWSGNFAAALPLDQEVLSIAEEHARPPYCQSTINECRAELARARQHYADSLRRNGRAKEALPLAEAGYQGQADSRGKFHPNTLDARLIVASVYGELGEREKAIAIEREVLDAAMENLGFEHPVTRKARANLAYSYSQQRMK